MKEKLHHSWDFFVQSVSFSPEVLEVRSVVCSETTDAFRPSVSSNTCRRAESLRGRRGLKTEKPQSEKQISLHTSSSTDSHPPLSRERNDVCGFAVLISPHSPCFRSWKHANGEENETKTAGIHWFLLVSPKNDDQLSDLVFLVFFFSNFDDI